LIEDWKDGLGEILGDEVDDTAGFIVTQSSGGRVNPL
jgi:hypothetical protein